MKSEERTFGTPCTSGKRQACNPHRDVLSSSLSHFHWKSFIPGLFRLWRNSLYSQHQTLLTTLASYNKTRAGSNEPTRAPSKYILPEQTCYFIMCQGRNLPLFSYHSNKTSLAEVSLQRTIFQKFSFEYYYRRGRVKRENQRVENVE